MQLTVDIITNIFFSQNVNLTQYFNFGKQTFFYVKLRYKATNFNAHLFKNVLIYKLLCYYSWFKSEKNVDLFSRVSRIHVYIQLTKICSYEAI